MMKFSWHRIEEQQERRKLLKSLLPDFAKHVLAKRKYKKLYPSAFVSAKSKVIDGASIGHHAVIRHSVIGANVTIGDFTTVGHRARMQGQGKITVGKFCSIAPEAFIWSENHKIDAVSTFPFEQFLDGRETQYPAYQGEDILIGHDVWVGQRAMILAGAHIGHGCVVAAGAVVPRGEYPPYSIIGGNPARVIRSRFDEKMIEKFLADPWWDKPADVIFGELMPSFYKKFVP